MPPTPFPAGKTIKELGIDTTRKFVVVDNESGFAVGTVLSYLEESTKPFLYRFMMKGQLECCSYLHWLAYYEPTEQEEWEPKVYDIVGVNLEVLKVQGKRVLARVPGALELEYRMWLNQDTITLISRPPAPRKVTMAEVNEKFGETVIIEG